MQLFKSYINIAEYAVISFLWQFYRKYRIVCKENDAMKKFITSLVKILLMLLLLLLYINVWITVI